MYIYKIIVALVLITSLYAHSTKVIAQPLNIKTPSTLKQQVNKFSLRYGVDSKLINKIIECESKGNILAIGDNGLSRGIAQFQKPTFNWLQKKLGEKLNYKSSYDQIKLLTWSVANGYGRNWSTYIAIKKGGEYSFYSRQLRKHFIIHCKL